MIMARHLRLSVSALFMSMLVPDHHLLNHYEVSRCLNGTLQGSAGGVSYRGSSAMKRGVKFSIHLDIPNFKVDTNWTIKKTINE
jgi:hypothetical protein